MICLILIKFQYYNYFTYIDEHGEDDAKLTIEAMEQSVDTALAKADYNNDGMIAWDEYIYSLHEGIKATDPKKMEYVYYDV